MPKKETILKYNHRKKLLKSPFITYAGMEPLLEKINTCYNDPKDSSKTKTNSHTYYSLLFIVYTLFI